MSVGRVVPIEIDKVAVPSGKVRVVPTLDKMIVDEGLHRVGAGLDAESWQILSYRNSATRCLQVPSEFCELRGNSPSLIVCLWDDKLAQRIVYGLAHGPLLRIDRDSDGSTGRKLRGENSIGKRRVRCVMQGGPTN